MHGCYAVLCCARSLTESKLTDGTLTVRATVADVFGARSCKFTIIIVNKPAAATGSEA